MASTNSIPVIDFANWSSSDSTPEQRLSIAQDLVQACQKVGFVYIINHGVPPSLLSEAFSISKELYDLPLEKKMLAPHPDGPTVHRGYSYPGLEKVSQVISSDEKLGEELRQVKDCKESYEIGSEQNSEQPNVWLPPSILPSFQPFMTTFYWSLSTLSHSILSAIGLGLGLHPHSHLVSFHSGHNNQLRLLHYPPIAASEIEDGLSARMPAHSDWGSITLLFQDECGGLEVEDRERPGEFVKAEPVEGALVMNVGDLLMRWSNDTLKSTLHRVTLPPREDRFTGPERMTKERYSIVYFVSPDSDSVIKCLSECTSEKRPVRYEPITQMEYRLMRGKLQYREKEVDEVVVN